MAKRGGSRGPAGAGPRAFVRGGYAGPHAVKPKIQSGRFWLGTNIPISVPHGRPLTYGPKFGRARRVLVQNLPRAQVRVRRFSWRTLVSANVPIIRQVARLRRIGYREALTRSAYNVVRPLHLALMVRNPKKVALCVRRHVRRQVLFAFRRAGFSGSARKKHFNRTVNSTYRC